MTTAQCRRILDVAFGHSAHSYRKGRAILHSIFAYGFRQELCDANPVARIEAPPVEEKPIEPLSNDEVGRLRDVVERRRFRDMRFSLSLLLYSGVRPAEVERLIREEETADLAAVWPMLSPRDRFLLESRYYLEDSDEQIAKQLGCSKSSVRTMLSRARKRALALMMDKEKVR